MKWDKCSICGGDLDRYGFTCKVCNLEANKKYKRDNYVSTKAFQAWLSRQTCEICGEGHTKEKKLLVICNHSVRNLLLKDLKGVPCMHSDCLESIQKGRGIKRKPDRRIVRQKFIKRPWKKPRWENS